MQPQSMIPKLIKSLFLLPLFLYCGKKQKDDHEDSAPIRRPIITRRLPRTYHFLDRRCQTETPQIDVRQVWMTNFQENGLKESLISLNGISSRPHLTSASSKFLLFGNHYKKECDHIASKAAKADVTMCRDANGEFAPWQMTPGKNVHVCQSVFQDKDRRGAERVGLTVLKHLDDMRASFQSLIPGASVPPLFIDLFPTLEILMDRFPNPKTSEASLLKLYLTDNLAFYAANDALGPRILVLPEPQAKNLEEELPANNIKSDAATATNGLLWEPVFVIGHEFGHYIEELQFGSLRRGLEVFWDPTIHGFAPLHNAVGAKSIAHLKAKTLTALSEGFADLLSFYLNRQASTALKGIKCLEINRDPTFSSFSGGHKKVLTDREFQIFSGTQNRPPIHSCSDPDFADPHDVGAVIAYQINRLFDLAEGGGRGLTLTSAVTSKEIVSTKVAHLLAFQAEAFRRIAQRSEMSAAGTMRSRTLGGIWSDIRDAYVYVTRQQKGFALLNNEDKKNLCREFDQGFPFMNKMNLAKGEEYKKLCN